MSQLSPNIINQIRHDWRCAPRGAKSRVIAKWCELIGYSYAKLYKLLGAERTRQKTGYHVQGIESIVEIVFKIKKKPPENLREISTEQAILIGIQNGLIPENMKNKANLINRIGRQKGYTKRVKRVSRFQAERPNQLQHVDGTGSKHFYIKDELPDGDWLLKLYAGAPHYKSKPVPKRVRPYIYVLKDNFSGYTIARYVAALGENAADALDFLTWAWSKKDDCPFFGLPEQIKSDYGPLIRNEFSLDLLSRFSIERNLSEQGNKRANGQVERENPAIFHNFELTFFAQADWKKFEITLSELNRQFMNYLEWHNSRPHRYYKNMSRLDVWKTINHRGGAVAMPENALKTVARRIERVVGADGCISIDNKIYEVVGLHAAKVYVYLGIFDDKIVVQDKKTGEKYEVRDFKPNPLGTFKAHKQTPHQKIKKESADLDVKNTLFESSPTSSKVAHFPAKIAETREIQNPLNTDAFDSVEKAMTAFMTISGEFPRGEEYQALKAHFVENGLSRRCVEEIAHEVLREKRRENYYV